MLDRDHGTRSVRPTSDCRPRSARVGTGCTVPALVGARVAATPHAPALMDQTGSLSYGELDRRSDAVARRLRARGVSRGSVVGVLVNRSAAMVVAWLGVLKVGAAYLPLDTAYPDERLRLTLADAHAEMALVEAATAGAVGAAAETLVLGQDGCLACPDPDAPLADVQPDDLAYVVYTSGSTGTPKGVMVEHRNIVNTCLWYAEISGVASGDRAGQTAAAGFDVASWEVWSNLAAGAELHIAPEAVRRRPEQLCRWIVSRRLRYVQLITPLATLGIHHGWLEDSALEALFIGGDKLHVRPPESASYRCFNLYGPTETAVVATSTPVIPGAVGDPPIGRPITGTGAAVLDEAQQPVSDGQVGELWLSGNGVSRGYLYRPGLTARSFRPDPAACGRTRYQTGDLVRRRPDGQLDFVGRVDDQVKVSGYRIELGEVENQLRAHPAVRDAAATVWKPEAGQPRLVGYVCGDFHDPGEVRRWLADRVPPQLVPTVLVPLAELPLTHHQKVDRTALPDPGAWLVDCLVGTRLEDPLQAALAEDWRRSCGVVPGSPDDTLVQVGASSIDLVALHSVVAARLGVSLSMPTFTLTQTLREQAGRLAAVLADRTRRDRATATGALQGPGSLGQESIAFLEEISGTGMRYQYQMILEGCGAPDLDLLERALLAVMKGQPALSAGWRMTRGGLAGFRRPIAAIPFRRHRAATADVESMVADLIREPLRYTDFPLLGWDVISHPGGTTLLQREHHVVHDGWSIGGFLRQLQDAYRCLADGREWTPPTGGVTYFDWAARQRERVAGTDGAEASRFWADHLSGTVEDRPTLPWQRSGDASGLHAERRQQHLGERRSAAIADIAGRLGVSTFALMLGAFRRMTRDFLGDQPRAIGLSVANRELGTEDVVGMFVNVLPLHRRGEPDETPDAVARAEMELLERTGPYQWLPTAEIVRTVAPQRDLTRNPLFQIMFSQHDAPMSEVRLGDWRPTVSELPNGYGKTDLDVIVRNRTLQHARNSRTQRGPGSYSLHWYHDPARYPKYVIAHMQQRFLDLLDWATERPTELWPPLTDSDLNGVHVS